MTEEQLKEIKARVEKAMVGPWVLGEEYEQTYPGYYVYSEANGLVVVAEEEGTFREEDAQFIVNARQDIPELITEVERCHKILENIQSELFSIRGQDKTHDGSITAICGKIREVLNGGDYE